MLLMFMGPQQAAVPSLQRLLDDGQEIVATWTQPDKPAGRGKKLHESAIKEFALQHNLTIHQPAKIKTPEAKALFASHNADAAIVVAYGKILPSEFLNAYKHGCINVHFSLLPKYRGAAPVNWTIVNGETETGVTTMRIVEELDAGPILLQSGAKIEEHATAADLLMRLAEMGAEVLSETLRNLDAIEPKPQRDADASFAPILRRENGLIDWSMDAFAIGRRVRGLQPWPNAYTSLDSKRLIIWRATPEQIDLPHAAGQVVEARSDRLAVSCGHSTHLRIAELQPEGGRRMSARDFINGKYVREGAVLGT